MQRYAVHIPLPSTLILLPCKNKQTNKLNYSDTMPVFMFIVNVLKQSASDPLVHER